MEDGSPTNPADVPYIVLTPTHALVETAGCAVVLDHQRLSSLSPYLSRALEEYQNAGHRTSMAVRLDGVSDPSVNVTDFGHFVWFLGVNPAEYARFSAKPAANEKFRRLAGVAAAAKGFECSDILEWAVSTALTEMEKRQSICTSAETLLILYQATELTQGVPSEVSALQRRRVEELWCDALAGTADLAPMLNAAQQAGSEFVVAHAYFYILRRGASYIRAEKRLSAIDRRRLMYGAIELARRGVCNCQDVSTRSAHHAPHKAATGDGRSSFTYEASKYSKLRSTSKSAVCSSGKDHLGDFNGAKSSSETVSKVFVDHVFVARVDPQICEMRGDLVNIFFQEPWPLD